MKGTIGTIIMNFCNWDEHVVLSDLKNFKCFYSEINLSQYICLPKILLIVPLINGNKTIINSKQVMQIGNTKCCVN